MVTACLTMSTVGDVIAAAVWVVLGGGLLVLLRHQQVERRRDARRRHAATLRALAAARAQGNVLPFRPGHPARTPRSYHR